MHRFQTLYSLSSCLISSCFAFLSASCFSSVLVVVSVLGVLILTLTLFSEYIREAKQCKKEAFKFKFSRRGTRQQPRQVWRSATSVWKVERKTEAEGKAVPSNQIHALELTHEAADVYYVRKVWTLFHCSFQHGPSLLFPRRQMGPRRHNHCMH